MKVLLQRNMLKKLYKEGGEDNGLDQCHIPGDGECINLLVVDRGYSFHSLGSQFVPDLQVCYQEPDQEVKIKTKEDRSNDKGRISKSTRYRQGVI